MNRGALGRWGDGEMGRWGDGEMGRWGDGRPACTQVDGLAVGHPTRLTLGHATGTDI
ncbi:MAG: hypothetical protein F6K56_04665 [Moorea sp. SIO3G5]|nr:hypothetical protein [Moorena sp. SIO3G5]